jgi:hypothetical protein
MTPHRRLSDADLDALLLALPRHAPTAGFADRVLARVPLASRVSVWRRIPWRALAALATLEVALAGVFVVRFHEELFHLPGRLFGGLGALLASVFRIEWGTAGRELLLVMVPRLALLLTPSVLVALLLGTVGALFAMSILGRASRVPTLSR